MGYFSNGAEGDIYHNRYCDKCAHDNGCQVMFLHMLWNYEQQENNDKQIVLDIFIPRDAKGRNLACSMFVKAE